MEDNDKSQTIIGQVQVFDGLDGQKLTVTTAEGDEYLIASKKWIKRLNKYADENIDISFEGTVEYDPEEGMDVINIKSFKPSQEVEDDLPTLISISEDMKFGKKMAGKKSREADDDADEIPLSDEEDGGAEPWDEQNDDDIEPDLDDLEDEDIPDDIDLDSLEDEATDDGKK